MLLQEFLSSEDIEQERAGATTERKELHRGLEEVRKIAAEDNSRMRGKPQRTHNMCPKVLSQLPGQ